jgi:hypothetical protein
MILDGSSSFISNMIEKERIVSNKSSRTVENGHVSFSSHRNPPEAIHESKGELNQVPVLTLRTHRPCKGKGTVSLDQGLIVTSKPDSNKYFLRSQSTNILFTIC